jgi:predicted Fe-S protein YdhL (DUF1289 family)
MITSPCSNICKMDATSGLCQGCFRTLDEITAWSRIDDPARIRILADVARRRRELAPRESELHHQGRRHE